MKINVTYEYKRYSKLMTQIWYSEKRAFFVVIVGILMILTGCFFLIIAPGEWWSKSIFFMGGLLLVALPLITSKIAAKRSFFSNKMLQGELVMEFADDTIITTGSAFKSEIKWSGLYRVKEMKDWFLLYHSKKSFLMVPKEVLGRKQEEFKVIIKNQSGLKYSFLKK